MFSTTFVLTPKKGTGTAASCESIANSSGLAESNDCVIRFAFFCSEDTPLCHIWQSRRYLASAKTHAIFDVGIYAELYYTIDTASGWLKGAIRECLQI